MKQQKLFAALLCAASPLAFAATEETPMDIVVVTDTRVEQPLKKSLSSVTVITQQDIKNSQAADVPSILRSVAGVELNQNGGMGKTTNLFLRGTNATHTLILLDGVRISSATSGTSSIQELMLDQVERIEIVRGNVSSLYGSEAIGGVIQIFTKKGRGTPAFNLSGGVGSLGTQRWSVGYGGAVERADFNLQLSRFKTNGVSALNPLVYTNVNPDKNGYDNTTLSANVRYAFNVDNSLAATAFDSRGFNHYDNNNNPNQFDVNTNKNHVIKYSLASDNSLNDIWQSHLQLARGMDDTQTFLNGVLDLNGGAIFRTANEQLTWQNTLQLNENNTLALGAEKLVQQVGSDVGFTTKTRKVNSQFAGYTGQYGSHRVQANWRQDTYSDFGRADTALLGYGYDISEAWRVTANTSTAFKAPTLNDLFYPFTDFGFGFTYSGNPALKPERSRNREIGVHYTSSNHRADVTYFNNRITDLITGNNLPAYAMVNLGEVRIEGAEYSYAGQFGNTGIKASLTKQNPHVMGNGPTLTRRTREHGSISISHALGSWQVGGEWVHCGTRPDVNLVNGRAVVLPTYNVLNLGASYAFDSKLKLSLRVDNLTRQNDATAYGYNPLGRTFFVGMSYQQ